MSYTEPQLNIFQVFASALDANVTPLYACIMGPKYGLHRYGVTDEEESVGAYDPNNATAYAWPNQASGSVVDQDSAKVFAKNASLQIYTGADFAIPAGQVGENEIETSSLVLQSKNGFSRSAVFGNRDVAIGDKVKVEWDSEVINTIITDLKGEIGSVVGVATPDNNNQAAVGVIAPNVTGDTVADSNLSFAAGGSYSGIDAGHVEETYVLTVTTGGVLGVAKASVVSASGTDDVSEVTLDDPAFAVGTRGVTLDITDSAAGVFVVGETITIYAREAYALPTVTEGGEYTGPKASTYIIQVTEGGVIDTDTPKLKVTTTNGVDIQAETDIVSGALVIGNYGVTLTFVAADQLVKGDAWTIAVTPEEENAIRTIVLGANLSSNGNDATDADVLAVTLIIEDTVEIDSEYITTDITEITVAANAATADLYGDTGNDLPILDAELFVEYREVLGGAVDFGSVDSILDVEAALGPVDPSNTLAYGVSKAAENSNGVSVYYISVPTDDSDGYTLALDRISTEDLIWSLVPLTKDASVLSLVKTYILEQSNEVNNNWKKGWFNSNAQQTVSVYTEEGGSNLQATITDEAAGSNYVNVNIVGANLTNPAYGITEGYILRYNPTPVDGNIVWDEATIASITNDENLVLQSSAIEMLIPTDVEIWRTDSLGDFANTIAAESNALGNRRINNIWPDTIPNELGEEVAGYFLCAALAAYRGAAAPHQPLTRAEITGFGSPERSLQFSRNQLNTIAEGGTWIVTSNIEGAVFTRHQLTTDMTSEETQEDSITSNLDSISRVYRDGFEPLIGKGNVTPDMLELLEGRIFTSFKFIHNLPYPRELGPQILGYDILELAQDPVIRSKVRIRIAPELPIPLNYLDLYFYVGG